MNSIFHPVFDTKNQIYCIPLPFMEVMFWNHPADNKITMLEVPVFWKEWIWGTRDI
jgi:hypothetical protein